MTTSPHPPARRAYRWTVLAAALVVVAAGGWYFLLQPMAWRHRLEAAAEAFVGLAEEDAERYIRTALRTADRVTVEASWWEGPGHETLRKTRHFTDRTRLNDWAERFTITDRNQHAGQRRTRGEPVCVNMAPPIMTLEVTIAGPHPLHFTLLRGNLFVLTSDAAFIARIDTAFEAHLWEAVSLVRPSGP
jgi:hypothetical protein